MHHYIAIAEKAQLKSEQLERETLEVSNFWDTLTDSSASSSLDEMGSELRLEIDISCGVNRVYRLVCVCRCARIISGRRRVTRLLRFVSVQICTIVTCLKTMIFGPVKRHATLSMAQPKVTISLTY